MLGVIALRSWWQGTAHTGPAPKNRLPDKAYRLLPWILIALIFYIPGIYLEWPSDPWEHLRRINEWHILDQVMAHSSWKKSSYFLPYSLTGHTSGLSQLTWLSIYYTGVCLLLSWQYYRLARAVGLGERASLIFVLLNAVTFGNNIFSFYRYYGLSSSILAQIGAVALTRIALEVASGSKEQGASGKEQAPGPLPAVTGYPRLPRRSFHEGRSTAYSLLTTGYSLLRPMGATLALLSLVAFNHIQGLGIAGLGVLAVIVWRSIEWKRMMAVWLALAAIALSAATIAWFPRHPAIDEVYRPQGWLTNWYGFDLLSFSSPALDRTMQILGAIGVLNFAPGLWLAWRHKHIISWLTLTPVIILTLPCFVLPLVQVLASTTNTNNIVTFHRFLFAVPTGLALVAAFGSRSAVSRDRRQCTEHGTQDLASDAHFAEKLPYDSLPIARFIVFCAVISSAVLASPGRPTYNRVWQSLQVPPDDLYLKNYLESWNPLVHTISAKPSTLVVTTALGAKVRETFMPTLDWRQRRQVHGAVNVVELQKQSQWRKLIQPSSWALAASTQPNWWLLSRREPSQAEKAIDLTASNLRWLHFGGSPPEAEFTPGGLCLKNQSGASTYIFCPELLPVDRSKRYQITMAIRQLGDPTAGNYLAVAWYDKDRQLLLSHTPSPKGAGTPLGWSNGTYSYFGLANRPATPSWTIYAIAFGFGEPAAIPDNAAYIRTGALLNFNSAPHTTVEIKAVTLTEKRSHNHLLLVAPLVETLRTPASQAAQLSLHWPPPKVASDYTDIRNLSLDAFTIYRISD